MTAGTRRQPLAAIGWREWVELPDLCPAPIKAKIDTGARTSTLHAFALAVEQPDDGPAIAHFEVHPVQRSARAATAVSMPVADFREVRSSDGRLESRPVIRTALRLDDRRWAIDLTLTRRDQMGFRLLLGRRAVRRKFIVDPGGSYLRSTTRTADRETS